MAHQPAEHIDADAGVGVPLRVGVPVGVGDDLALVELGAVGGAQHGHASDPGAVVERQAERGDGLAPVGVAPVRRQQLQLADRRVGIAGAHPVILVADQLRGGLGDRQPAAETVGLVVVIDEHRQAVVVTGQAVQRQRADLLGSSAGVDGQLDAGAHDRRAEVVQMGAQLAHDLRGQVAGGLGGLRLVRHVGDADREVLAQTRRWSSGPRQARGPSRRQHLADLTAGSDPPVDADGAGGLLVGKPVQEELHVGSAERGGDLPAVGAHPQTLRQPGHAADVMADRQTGLERGRPPLGQVGGGPPLGQLTQPRLADLGERHGARLAEHHQIPLVFDDLGFGGGQRPPSVRGDGVAQGAEGAVVGGGDEVGERGDLLAAQLVAQHPQVSFLGLHAVNAAALLQPDEHLGDHQRGQSAEADLSADADRRAGQPPALLIQVRVSATQSTQPHLMSLAIHPVGMTALPGAGGNLARAAGHTWSRRRMGAQLGGADPEPAGLLQMAATHARPRRHAFAGTAGDRAAARATPRAGAGRQPVDLGLGQSPLGEPTTTRPADPSARRRGGPTSLRPAHRTAQQRMLRRAGQHQSRRVPSRFDNEGRIQRSGQRSRSSRHGLRGEDMRRLWAQRCDRDGARGGAHRPVPVCCRGLATRSMASRSRAGSGCRYTRDDDIDA